MCSPPPAQTRLGVKSPCQLPTHPASHPPTARPGTGLETQWWPPPCCCSHTFHGSLWPTNQVPAFQPGPLAPLPLPPSQVRRGRDCRSHTSRHPLLSAQNVPGHTSSCSRPDQSPSSSRKPAGTLSAWVSPITFPFIRVPAKHPLGSRPHDRCWVGVRGEQTPSPTLRGHWLVSGGGGTHTNQAKDYGNGKWHVTHRTIDSHPSCDCWGEQPRRPL